MKKISAICAMIVILMAVSTVDREIDFTSQKAETPIYSVRVENNINKLITEKKDGISVFEQVSKITGEDVASMKIISVYEAPPPKTYSDDDLFCVAAAIYNEHGGDYNTDAQRYIDGWVILNRVHSGRFATTIRGVLESKGQYDGFENGVKFPKRAKLPVEQEAVKRAYRIAESVLNGDNPYNCPPDLVYQSEHPNLGILWKKIGNTYYARYKH